MGNSLRKTAEVAVFLPVMQTYHYHFGKETENLLKPGVRVVVPFRNRSVVGVFTRFTKSDIETKEIKTVLDENPLFPQKLFELAEWISKYYLCGPGEVFKLIAPKDDLKKKVSYKRGEAGPERLQKTNREIYELLSKPLSAQLLAGKAGLTVKELDKKTKPLVKKGILEKKEEFYFAKPRTKELLWEMERSTGKEKKKKLTDEQLAAVKAVSTEIEQKSGKTTLLFGVTGSGKTEVYINLCQKALERGSAIVLVPEIALTYQLVKRFLKVFGKKIALLHSGLTHAERRSEWKRAQSGEAKIVIGARSAIFAPLKNLQLIVVDEEHDASYKQSDYPYYNARDVAVVLGKICGAAILLGSATPSLESFYNATHKKYLLRRISKRVDGAPMPKVDFIQSEDSSTEPKTLPTRAIEKIIQRLGRKEQSLVFINRRGASRYLKCAICKEAIECPNCSITLTYHSYAGKKLACHYCGYEEQQPFNCRSCGVRKGTFSHRGVGTQKLESFLKELFPKAMVDRLDHDTAPDRKKVFEILEKFETGQTDILVGTQMTAKGHDFANLTFSIIVGADDYLAFPDFRSAEKTFSLITQAAGRTGRGKLKGEVIVSGAGDHYAIRHALTHDYESFYKEELDKRRMTGYPPFSRLIGLRLESNSQEILQKEMNRISEKVKMLFSAVEVLGPTEALIYKLRNRYRWKMLLKGKNIVKLHNAAIELANIIDPRISVLIDVDPIRFY